MKILITGPESSGKSTLCSELDRHLNCILIPEYARTYLEENGPKYSKKDLLEIAKYHYQVVKVLEKECNPNLFVLDTFLLNIKIWSEVKYGKCDPWLIEKLSEIKYDLIFLLKPNLPWVEDPLRESKHIRDELFEIYKKELKSLNWKYHIIDEVQELRTQQALDIIALYDEFPS